MKILRWMLIAIFMSGGGSLWATSASKGTNLTDQWLAKNAPTSTSPQQLQALYDTFIRGYWVPQTGLVLSFPGSGDERLTQQAALYDQGIAGICMLAAGDTIRAQKMIDFLAETWDQADHRSGPRKGKYGLSNFYNAYYGMEGIEKTMHVGPNAWIGLLASRAYRKTHNPRDLTLALKIAHWMLDKVPHAHGAIAMGEIRWNGIPWPEIYSTENNLSTYAFFGDLLKSSGLSQEDRRRFESEHNGIGHWLLTQAYQRDEKRVIRGFNAKELDTAGAIDSYTWYTDALQPATLRATGIPIETLVKHAENDFTVTVGAKRGVDCVDTATADKTYEESLTNPALTKSYLRPAEDGHRLIWYEGTGQFIVLLLDAAHDAVNQAVHLPESSLRTHRFSQAEDWLKEADYYTKGMDEASMQLPWGKTYPCATGGQFYIYGWPAPAGTHDHLSDASAALVWRLFVGLGYEPLTDRWLSAPSSYRIRTDVRGDAGDPHTTLLYGASEEMTAQAWKFVEQKDFKRAREQAEATIKLWEPYARDLEKKKESTIRGFLPYDGTVKSFQAIADYWALNDVAACYFILGRLDDEEHNTVAAQKNFATILHDFPLAQVWDPKGWFWNPLDAVKSDYVEGKPTEYHALQNQIPAYSSSTQTTSPH